MKKAHIVVRETGEYSSRSEIPIAVYFDEILAKKHVELASARARELEVKFESEFGSLDPDMTGHEVRDGVWYHLFSVPILENDPAGEVQS